MLPTTGHFKNLSCPFYETCICERPYCHFKHSKRETVSDTNLISELVSKAVHKVLNSNLNATPDPQERSNEAPSSGSAPTPATGTNVTYNPTPIAELNKYKGNSSSSENTEKKSRHIPIQYTPEQPRSSRSTSNNYSSSLEYTIDDCPNTSVGYSPTPSIYSSSVSYVPSSIKTLTENSSLPNNSSDNRSTVTGLESKNQLYVPSSLSSSDLYSDLGSPASVVKYSPTKNLNKYSTTDNTPSENEYVPKYNDEFIDDFLNDPNIYEPTEIISNKIKNNDDHGNKSEAKDCTKESKSTSKSSSSSQKSDEKSKKHHSHSSSSKSSSSKSKQSDTDRKSTSSSSKHSSKDKHSSKSKDDEQSNGHGKKQKSTSDKHSNTKSKSSSRDKQKISSDSRTKSKDSVKKSEKVKPSDKHKSKTKKPVEDIVKVVHVSDDDPIFLDDLSDYESDDSTMEQCKRIFEEYQPPAENLQAKVTSKPVEPEIAAVASTSKKRVAHDKSTNVFREKIAKPTAVRNAALVMANRYKHVLSKLEDREQSRESELTALMSQISKKSETIELMDPKRLSKRSLHHQQETNTSEETSQDNPYHIPAKIKRIAHVPNVSSLLSAKKKVEEIVKVKHVSKTPTQTISKGSKRVAHIPEVSFADIPSVLQSEKSKLPVNVRSRYLFLMVKECSKLYLSKQAAYDRALNEELNCYSKCSAITTYRNSVMLSINRLRKEAESGLSLNGKAHNADNSSEFEGKKFYKNLKKWILTEEELVDNGYPRPGADKKGYAVFKCNKIIERIPQNSELCVRCKKIFPVDEDGYPVYPEDCVYHPGSRFVFRGEAKYICCQQTSASDGCCICTSHVYETRDPSDLSGFVKTFDPEHDKDPRSRKVYALDCEMVYSTRGFELARVTVINHKCDVVYESLVKPLGHVLDCNTRYSGLTTEMLNDATTRITEVQATLLLIFNSKTILIGHSLESDLKALRIIHNTVIDTSVLFPHKMGPPKKRGLRALASDYLKKIIQNSESGHDSAEDANACMELVIWKLKEELKTR